MVRPSMRTGLPITAAASHLCRDRFVPISGPIRPLRMGLMSAAGGQSSLTVQAFADHCRKMLPGELLAGLTVRGTS